jgi:multicomponent Na+:H+ antiporter subunit G
MLEILGSLIILTGSLFLFSAGLGVYRMPDTYNRVQTGTKASTLGTILVLTGMGVWHPAWFLKLVILIFFVMITNPVSSHALVRAMHNRHLLAKDVTTVDKLEEQQL